MNLFRWRFGFALVFLACAGMIGFALYHQFYQWLMPCLYCVYERIGIIVTGLLALVAAIFPPKTRAGVYTQTGLLTVAAGVTAAVGIRHTWYQYTPRDPSALCPSSLPFPIDLNALPGWLASVIRPVGDCGNIDFTLFGITMPAWVAVAGIAIVVWSWSLCRHQLNEIRRNQWR
ncbi:disulfide bond formation protein B [Chitinibacter tainanensis]|uniref:disulfide bond formation protein B n=1 Tax=Chitinibacter tainanensis TaxID=230667 RepID=UPI0023577959|nr:disulfide bond formation protein B [Chitinibacter tainanensis]